MIVGIFEFFNHLNLYNKNMSSVKNKRFRKRSDIHFQRGNFSDKPVLLEKIRLR
jgi:hypothetical protein